MPATTPSASLKVQPICVSDLDAVMQIETQVFSAPWSRESYLELIPQAAIKMWTMKNAEQLVGYMLYQCWAEEMELHTIAVDPQSHGQGIGKLLMEKLFAEAQANSVIQIYLQVRVSNERAIQLYERFNFKKVGMRKRYYQDNFEDAFVMRATLAKPN